MEKNLTVIESREVLGKEFRVYGTAENPLFLAKDVAKWIDYGTKANGSYNVSQMLAVVEDEEKLVCTFYTSGQNRNIWFLTEDGLYEVLMQSRKPLAKEFKKKVKEILKDIRKNGMYATDELLDNPDLLIEVVTKLKEERVRNKLLQEEKQALALVMGEQKPKVEYYEEYMTANGLFLEECKLG